MNTKPNIIVILNDDMGYSDIGCYGGEIDTPNLNRLANNGLRFTQFYNTARCCPSRASLLTGLHPHQADIGNMTANDDADGYRGDLSQDSATLAEVLKANGYGTYMTGKWHVSHDVNNVSSSWPCQRGFDEFYGTLAGAGSYYAPKALMRNNTKINAINSNYYYTDAISDEAVTQIQCHRAKSPDTPFFQYVAYTAPHWPLHAKPEDIEKYKGRYDCGWDKLREQRLQRMAEMGLISNETALSPRDPSQPPWDEVEDKAWQAKRMEVYAAQIDCMDQGIGRIIEALETEGELDNTLIIFLADNGGCHEEIEASMKNHMIKQSAQEFTRDGRPVRFGNTPDIEPGPEDTFTSYGLPWANVSNTPFRKFKCWIHEGGISTPFISHWPNQLKATGALRTQPAQLPDIMATCIDAAGAVYPTRIDEREIQPHEGFSLLPSMQDDVEHGREILTWEHQNNCGIRRGKWKLVREHIKPWQIFEPYDKPEDYTPPELGAAPWELYDIGQDRSELNDLSADHPDLVEELAKLWQEWADRCMVKTWEDLEEWKRLNTRA